jgi:hypothetical protein
VSSQLEKIRGSLANMGGGQAASGIERLKRQTSELTEQVKGLGAGFTGGSNAALTIAKSVGLATAGVVAFGAAVVKVVSGLGEYATQMQRIGNLSRQTGLGAAQIKEMQEQWERSGVSAEKAQQNLAGLAAAMADIQKVNSELRQKLLAGAPTGNYRQQMEMLLGELGRVANDPAAFANLVRRSLDEIYDNVLRDTRSSVKAAQARQAFAEAFQAPDLPQLQGQFATASAAANQAMGERIRQAREYQAITTEIGQSWGKIGDAVNSALTPAATAALKPLAATLGEAADQIERAIETLKSFEPPEWMRQAARLVGQAGTGAANVLNTVNTASSAAGRSVGEATGLNRVGPALGRALGFGGKPAITGIDAAAAMQVPAFAAGGAIGAGELGLVGEAGPELFKPGQSGTIIPTWASTGIYGAALAAEMGLGIRGLSGAVPGAMRGHGGAAGGQGIGEVLAGGIPGAPILAALKRDSESGHPLRTRLRALLGLEDPGEPAPWQRRQSGGPVSAGNRYLVGEAGPELFMGGGGEGGGEGSRLIAEQNQQVRALNDNTEDQNREMRTLNEQLQTLNATLAPGGTPGGGGGIGGFGGGGGTLGGSMGGGPMRGLSGLPGFGGGRGGVAGGGGSAGGGGASGGWTGSSGVSSQGGGATAAPEAGGRAGQAGAGSGKAAAEAYLGKSISDGEYDSLMRATHAESGGKNSPEEQAMIMGTILNRARKHPAGIIGALNAPNQFQAVTGTRFDPGPSRNYRQGPNESRRASIEGAAQNLLHRVPTSQTNFTAASRAAYGAGTNVGYLDQLQRTGGAVYGGTQFGGRLAPEGDSLMGGGAAAGRVKELQGKVAGIRKLAIQPDLRAQLEAAAASTDLGVEIFSGGQHKHGHGPRTGSTRHDEGGAADLKLRDPKTGRILDMLVPEDQRRMAAFTQAAVAEGATGVGAGLGYMGPSSIHVGGGKPAAWGGVRGEAAPDWLAGAHQRGLTERQQRLARGRASMDRDSAEEMTHRVEGTGKLTVDVNAPAGTKVAAEGGGLFKNVETNRQTQMQPAAEGPSTG